MKPITLPTSEEVRVRLKEQGATLFEYPGVETYVGAGFSLTLKEGEAPDLSPNRDWEFIGMDLSQLLAVCSILGIVETPQTPAGDANKQRQYGLALAALSAGVVCEPHRDGWTAHVDCDANLPAYELLLKAHCQFTMRPTQVEALAAAAEALGLEPIHLMVETPRGVMVPAEVAHRGSLAMASMLKFMAGERALADRIGGEENAQFVLMNRYKANAIADLRAALSGDDVCECGDLRHEHTQDTGACSKCETYPVPHIGPCTQFRPHRGLKSGAGSSQVDGGGKG